MMAHLIKLFNCSGNHYHHHRCSIIHHFWRALLTSGAHSPALLKRGQISPTPLGVSAGYDLSPVESCPKAYSEAEMKREKEKKKKAYPPSRLLPLILILSPHNSLLSLSLSPSQTHTEYFILLERPPHQSPGKSGQSHAQRIRYFLLSRMGSKLEKEAAVEEQSVFNSLGRGP